MGIQNQQYVGGRAQLELRVQIGVEKEQPCSPLVRLCLERLRDSVHGILVLMLSILWHYYELNVQYNYRISKNAKSCYSMKEKERERVYGVRPSAKDITGRI